MNNPIVEPEFVRPPRIPKAEKRWTLLFIGDRGKTITFHRFKSLVMLALLILLASAAVSGWFWYLYDNARIESRNLNEKLENLEQALASARNEKDILTARLVVAESKAEQNIARMIAESPVKPPVKSPPKTSQPVQEPADDKRETVASVLAENFLVFYEPDVNTLSVQYKIRNTGSKEQPVSGRSVVILKDSEENPKKWLVLPPLPLVSGKPVGDKGRSFSIYNFRTMRFKTNDQIGPDQYVAELPVLLYLLVRGHDHGFFHNRDEVQGILNSIRGKSHINPDQDIGTHGLHMISGEVIENPPVDIKFSVYFHGKKNGGDGHAGPHA